MRMVEVKYREEAEFSNFAVFLIEDKFTYLHI